MPAQPGGFAQGGVGERWGLAPAPRRRSARPAPPPGTGIGTGVGVGPGLPAGVNGQQPDDVDNQLPTR